MAINLLRGAFEEKMKKVVKSEKIQGLLDLLYIRESHDWNEARNLIRKPLRNFFYKRTMRTPMILPMIFRI